MQNDFVVSKNGIPIARLTNSGELMSLPGAPQELLRRLTATLLSGLPEGDRLELLLRRLAGGDIVSIPVARLLPEISDLSGGLEIMQCRNTMTPLRYLAPPELPISTDGEYHRLDTEVQLTREWYNARQRIQVLQPNPSFCGVQDKFTAVAERQGNKMLLRPAGANERGNVLIKPHRSDVPFMAETEFICMRTAKYCGFQTAECFLFESPIQGRLDIRVMDLAVLRFDRHDDGTAREVVDFAALMGLDPELKYSMSRSDMLVQAEKFLPPAELARLTEALFFGTLIGNGDMHLKNFSAMREPEDDAWRLAPLYDMLSTEALRYETHLGLLVNRNAYAPLMPDEIRMGRVSVDKLEEIATRVEMFLPKLAQAVLTDSERPGFHTAHSLAKRMGATVRRHAMEARRQLIPFPQEREDITEPTPDDPSFYFDR